jgi:hypothetical protein
MPLPKDIVFDSDKRRRAIYDGLTSYNPVLAGLYKSAIRNFKTPAYKGEERARLAIIGNSMREVMNALASVIGDSSPGKEKVRPEKLLRDLPGKLALFPDLSLKQDIDYIPVPKDAALLIAEVVDASSQETMNVREDVASLLTEGSSINHPAVKQWIDARSTFVKLTHISRPPEDIGISDTDIESTIRVVEDLIEVRIGEFFESKHSLEEILGEINEQEEE